MDPISQGVVGAIMAHAFVGKPLPRAAAAVGALAGMAPDLDIFIPTFGDPTAGWVWHRGPSHALLAVPILGALAAVPFLALPRLREHWRATMMAAILGLATHGPLDALTSYGTQLFWPISNVRVAMDWMPIIDPIFTLTLLGLVITAAILRSRRMSVVAAMLMLAYIGFGGFQHHRATHAVEALAASRGHEPRNLRAMPAPAALSLWRGLYEHDGELHADGLFIHYLGPTRVRPGESRPLSPPIGEPGSDDRRHFDRFDWFSQGTVYTPDPAQPNDVSDGRYSGDVAGFAPLWGLSFGSTTTRTDGTRDVDAAQLLDEILGRDERYAPLRDLLDKLPSNR